MTDVFISYKRAARRLRRYVLGGGLIAAFVGFVWTTPVVRETGCGLPVPGLARACCLAGLTDKVEAREEAWTPADPFVVAQMRLSAGALFPTEAEARADAEVRLREDVALTCTPNDPTFQRLANAQVQNSRFQCTAFAQGWTCAVDYAAACAIEERRSVKRCPG